MSIILIKYSLLNFFFIKQIILHLKCSVSSTVPKFEHCHYIRWAILHTIATFLYLQFQLLMNNPNLARQWSVITYNMKLTRNHYPVRYKRESFFSADNDSHLRKVSENETRMYNLCTLNGKELDMGHNSSPNSELSYWCHVTVYPQRLHTKIKI